MRRSFLSAVLVAAVGFAAATTTGCSVHEQFVTAMDEGLNRSGLLDEYDAYVDADPKLKPETKKIRKETSALLRKLVQDAKKQ